MEKQIIINATDGNLGRIASYAAKQALLGKEIIILNCNEAQITGNPKTILAKYQVFLVIFKRCGDIPKVSRLASITTSDRLG